MPTGGHFWEDQIWFGYIYKLFSIDLMRIYFSFFVEGLCFRSVVSKDVLQVSLALLLVQCWRVKFILPHFVDGHICTFFNYTRQKKKRTTTIFPIKISF